MKQDTQIELIERILTHVSEGTTDVFAAPDTFDPTIYCDPERLAAERKTLFRSFPLVVGFSSQVKEPGDFFTHDLTETPILVTRTQDGEIQAFANVCRHRGARVTTAERGCKQSNFVCPYHAWSYDLRGTLRGLPEPQCFPNVRPGSTSLLRLPAAERHGMIWVVPTPGAELDIDAYLGAYGQDLHSYGLSEYVVGEHKNVPGRIDWKLMIEANQENYHINFLHKASAGRRYRKQCSLADIQTPHTRSVLVLATTGQATMPADRSTWRLLDYGDLVYFIFPNTLLLWAGGGVQVISAFPRGVGRSIMQGARLVPPTSMTAEARNFGSAFYGNYWVTIGEDIKVSETIQQGASMHAGSRLILGSNETLIAQFHTNIERALSGSLTAASMNAQPASADTET